LEAAQVLAEEAVQPMGIGAALNLNAVFGAWTLAGEKGEL
jgi:hypothetical protein